MYRFGQQMVSTNQIKRKGNQCQWWKEGYILLVKGYGNNRQIEGVSYSTKQMVVSTTYVCIDLGNKGFLRNATATKLQEVPSPPHIEESNEGT